MEGYKKKMQNDTRDQTRMPSFNTPISFCGRNLSYKIKTNENIFGIRINDYEIRYIQHADDLTITVQDENSLSQALNTVHEFWKHAG